MKRIILLIIVIIIIGVALGIGVMLWQRLLIVPDQPRSIINTNANQNNDAKIVDVSDLIKVTNLKAGDKIKNPLLIEGEARGNWYFEGTFTVKLVDAEERDWAIGSAQAQGDWTTTDFVPFKGTLEFTKPLTQTGKVVLKKDNPSGLPENDAQVEIPVGFE